MRETIVKAIARSLFVQAYADYVERESNDGEEADDVSDLPRPGAGGDWKDYAPETSGAALATAEKAAASIERLNGVDLGVIFERAGMECALGRCQRRRHTPEDFGSDLGMMLTGSGASWFDDHARFPLKVPSVSFYIFGRSDLTAGEEQAATVNERFAREE